VDLSVHTDGIDSASILADLTG